MKVIDMPMKKFDKLKEYELPNCVLNTESKLFIIDEKNKWERYRLLVKKLYNDSGLKFSNKLYTVNELYDNRDVINMDELIIPEYLYSVHGNIVGFASRFIENINFKELLMSNEFSDLDKINYLKEIGNIIEKMGNIRKYTEVEDFYLNDLHESNFILNRNTKRINAVDMDSCKINGNKAFASKFLTPVSKIYDVNKYEKEESVCGGVYKISDNTEYYCYVMMILNYIANYKVNGLSIDEFYYYMEYLHKIGLSYELVDMFSLVYMEKDNVNPYLYLDELVGVIGKSDYKVYKRSKQMY